MKKFIILFLWFLSLVASVIWSYENPEKVERLKDYFKKKKNPEIKIAEESFEKFTANAFDVDLTKIIDMKEKTAFLIYPIDKREFNINNLKIYTQNGYLIENFKQKKLFLPSNFTLQRNGGVKTIISIENHSIALISAQEKECYFASLILLTNGKELLRTKCLPEEGKNNDFNGIGSSNIHLNEFIYFSLGTPEKHVSKNSTLAQKDDSLFGKILRIKKNVLLETIVNNKEYLEIDIFSKGHRVPQGLTKIDNTIFNVEHGPKGGDEINRVRKNGNYGWPSVSYGTNYLKSNGGDGKSIPTSHELNNFEEPLLALVPSIGISSINNCPKILIKYYKKKCLIALSLYGNNLRRGNSLIIFLLNNELTKIDSFEIIQLTNHILRHFVTNKLNELYEDEDGNIYVSADKEGVLKLSFNNFR